VLKFFPHLEFVYDPAGERGARLNALLDELGLDESNPPPPPDAPPTT
jgi:ribosome-binding factor A